MSSLQAVILFLLVPCTSAVDYCSKLDTVIKCVPCSDICPENTKCENFRCPKQCTSSSSNMCQRVCGWECQNQTCEYADDGGLLCSEGCLDGLTGKLCKESCPENCKICQQFSLECNTCKDSFNGKTCTDSCPKNCKTCQQFTSECNNCKDGFKGKSCSEKDHSKGSTASTDERSYETTSGSLTASSGSSVSAPPGYTSYNEPAVAETSGTVNLAVVIVGIVAALVFTAIAVLIVYVMKRRQLRPKSERIEKADVEAKSEHDTGGYHSYDYIDDVSARSNHARLHSEETRKPSLQETYPGHKRGTHAVPSSEYEKYLPLK